MSPISYAFFTGMWFGITATCVGLALMVRAAARAGRNPVVHRPVPVDRRELELHRLQHVDFVLWRAMGSQQITRTPQ